MFHVKDMVRTRVKHGGPRVYISGVLIEVGPEAS